MMQRYKNIQTNNLIYKSVSYPNIDKLNSDTYIISNNETRLDLLAYHYYNDSTLYWIIAICNNIKGTIFVTPGTQLCIPNKNRINIIISRFNELNNG